ncbi:sensor histidine kinase [Thermodesulfatator indicus]|nr:ATP-binding protein [Thermodesulfatator indicus]
MRREAKAIYEFVVLAREWISSKGGIYIKNGENFEKITPSHFTKELAAFAKPQNMIFTFKVAVINTNTPYHIPDEFEKEAIQAFQTEKLKEFWKLENDPKKPLFRYAAPLEFEKVCSNCHSDIENYQPPACISITLSAKPFLSELKKSYKGLILSSIFITILIFLSLYLLLKFFVLNQLNKFIKATKEIEKGNLSTRVNIKSKDEWQILSKYFNSMLETLVKHQEKLEEEVKKATEELYQAYSELKKAEKYRSEFFSNITHELKTPVTAIKGTIDLIERKGNIDQKQIEIIKKNIEKLAKMIKDLLDYSKIESGQIELMKEENSIFEVIEDAILLVSPLANQKNIKIEIKGKDTTTYFDYEKIQQVISNLLVNAIKFSPPEGKIIITVSENKDEVIVSIEDFGPGIPKEEREKVFNKFYRVAKNQREGIGLGLAICKGIVENHGGKIWVEEPDHQGCVFKFTLPKKGE